LLFADKKKHTKEQKELKQEICLVSCISGWDEIKEKTKKLTASPTW